MSLAEARAKNGSAPMKAAKGYYEDLLAGKKDVKGMDAPGKINDISNPYIGRTSTPQAASGQINEVGANLGMGSIASGGASTAGKNAFAGLNNPYLQQQIDYANKDITGAIDSKFNGNAFGGTAHQQTLARELARNTSNMRMQDYGSQMGLAENAVNRDLSNQQYNIGNQNQLNQFNAGLSQSNANTLNQMGQFNAGLQGQNINNQNTINANNTALGAADLARNANMFGQQAQFNAGLQGQNVNNAMTANQFNVNNNQNNVNRATSNLGFGTTLANNDFNDINALNTVGGAYQNQAQKVQDWNYQQFQDAQNYGQQQMGYLQAGINPASAAFKNSYATAQPQQQPNPWATAAGAFGAAAGAYKLFGTP
jgi:hypothetical protein